MANRRQSDLSGDYEDLRAKVEALERIIASSLHDNVSGVISAAGAIVSGTGFTVTKGGAGLYSIQFVPPLSGTPAITFGADAAGGSDLIVEYSAASATAFNVQVLVVSAGLGDRAFSFNARV
jgi:hypothetical protein